MKVIPETRRKNTKFDIYVSIQTLDETFETLENEMSNTRYNYGNMC